MHALSALAIVTSPAFLPSCRRHRILLSVDEISLLFLHLLSMSWLLPIHLLVAALTDVPSPRVSCRPTYRRLLSKYLLAINLAQPAPPALVHASASAPRLHFSWSTSLRSQWTDGTTGPRHQISWPSQDIQAHQLVQSDRPSKPVGPVRPTKQTVAINSS